MSEIESKDLPLPEKQEGGQKEFVEKAEASNVEEAKALFADCKRRLLDVNNWDKICGTASAVFELTEQSGTKLDGPPVVGNYFRIDVPGPGTAKGEGYDWVRVEAIEEKEDPAKDTEYIVIRVRPSDNPTTASDDVAHFFSDEATSNFILIREGLVVTAAVVGRNEKPNTNATASIIDKIRNAIVGTGAVAGMSHPQWNSLVKGVIGSN